MTYQSFYSVIIGRELNLSDVNSRDKKLASSLNLFFEGKSGYAISNGRHAILIEFMQNVDNTTEIKLDKKDMMKSECLRKFLAQKGYRQELKEDFIGFMAVSSLLSFEEESLAIGDIKEMAGLAKDDVLSGVVADAVKSERELSERFKEIKFGDVLLRESKCIWY